MSTTVTDGEYSVVLPAVNDPVDADTWGTTLNNWFANIPSWMKTRIGDMNFADYVLSRAKMKDTAEAVYSLGNISGAVAVDYTNGHWQYGTLTGNITGITISNPPATGSGGFLTLELIQDGTGSRTLTLDSAVYLTSGNATITLTTAASSVDKLRFETRNAGTTWSVFPNLDIR